MSFSDPRLKLFTGNANPELAREIANHIGLDLGVMQIARFRDGEIQIKLGESVRGCNVFVVQPTSAPVNEHLMELLVTVDALKRASAKSINVVLPYYGYARQDRKARARDPITAKLVADLIQTAGASRVICMDLHAGQIQGFFNIPLDHLVGMPILARYFEHKNLENVVVVSPDLGGVTRARQLAERLGATLAIIDKRRPEPNVSEVMNIIGDVRGRHAILIDDIIDTGGTIALAAEALREQGAASIYACCTHAVLSPPALDRLNQAPIEEVVVTNTIARRDYQTMDKLVTLSVAEIIAEAIMRVNDMRSISELFD
ncbi:ribose-phosphate diphosphokinase [Ferroacidibacillus organovorans]|uniref:Ribose-phosphate pyrophosphokinase n=1 Tax=Ferroacidibacillus organovorans TaxID=1765683 RepID=A0A101XSA4_9BACL|nr:ribose-phosphate pyrophosphokinase [Ferroacidibacillus organovorans]KUO96602.1 ribose-phosphate pyrophosphokinase [Ferroacidibacillus organovorans]